MSDEALNAHLDWLDDCAKEQAGDGLVFYKREAEAEQMIECTNPDGHVLGQGFNIAHMEEYVWCIKCERKWSKAEVTAMLNEDAALKRIEDAAREWNKAHPNPNGHCDTDDLRGCVTARALKDALLTDNPTKPPKRTARQSGTVESFGEGLVPDYLVFTDEYGRRWRLESQYDGLRSLAIPIAQIIKPGRHRLSIVIDEETSDREKDALVAFYEEFKLTGEEQLTLKEIKDKYLPNRDLDELRGVTREEQEDASNTGKQ